MNIKEKLAQKIVKEAFWKFEHYSKDKGHKILTVSARGASLDVADFILSPSTLELLRPLYSIKRDKIIEEFGIYFVENMDTDIGDEKVQEFLADRLSTGDVVGVKPKG